MAKVNPVKIKQDAEKEERAGRLDKAIALYRQLLEANPKDWNTVNKIGDLFAKLNRAREATQEYAKVADFYTRDGFLLKAIAVWKKVVRLDASALDPYVKLADLYGKQGLLMEAKSQYQIVVDEYLKKGKAREAGDALRKMVEIDPADLKLQSRLAELYIREGRKDKAVEVYIAIADQLNQKGHLAEAVQVLQKGLKMDPSSSQLRLELARIHLLQKNFDKATSFLEEARRHAPDDPSVLAQLGEAYLGSKRLSEAEEIYRRLVKVAPDDKESRTRMGRLYLAKGDLDAAFEEFAVVVEAHLERDEPGSAITLMQELLARKSDHVKSLVKLVEIHRIQKNDSAVVQAYSNLSDAYIKQGQLDQAASVLDILVSMEPQNQQHRSKLDMVRQKLGGGPGAAPQPAAAPAATASFEAAGAEPIEDFSLDLEPAGPSFGEPDPGPAFTPPAPAAASSAAASARPSIELSGPLSDEDQEFIDEHLAEGRVFRKYGLVDKAAEQFLAVVARFADHAETREELCDVYKEKGEAPAAAEQYLALAEIHRLKGDETQARACEDEARGLSPESVPPAPGPAPMAQPAPAPRSAAPAPAPVPVPEPEPLSMAQDSADEDIPIGVDEPAEEFPLDLGEPDEDIQIGGGEDEDDVMSGLGGPATTDEEFSLDLPGVEAPAPLAVPPAPLQAAAAPPSAASSGVPAELQKALADVEQYMSLGFVDDAKEALRQIQARHPDHPAIQQKVAELGFEEGADAGALDGLGLEEPLPMGFETPSPVAEPSLLDDLGDAPMTPPFPMVADPPPLQGEGLIDLGAELGDILGAQSAVEEPAEEVSGELGDLGLTEIFNEFRRGVDKQLGQEDYDTRYNLGIAYKEMGLVDEAISEFQLAAKDPARIFECSSMLGICFIEKGMPKIAVNWFLKALRAPGRGPEEYAGLRYDLASAHEAAGEVEEAVNLLTDLYAENSGFRDVATRLRELKAASR